jgi:hypothetical protein
LVTNHKELRQKSVLAARLLRGMSRAKALERMALSYRQTLRRRLLVAGDRRWPRAYKLWKTAHRSTQKARRRDIFRSFDRP